MWLVKEARQKRSEVRGAALLTAVDPEDVARNTLITMFAPQISHTSLLLKEQPASSIIRAPQQGESTSTHTHTHIRAERGRERESWGYFCPRTPSVQDWRFGPRGATAAHPDWQQWSSVPAAAGELVALSLLSAYMDRISTEQLHRLDPDPELSSRNTLEALFSFIVDFLCVCVSSSTHREYKARGSHLPSHLYSINLIIIYYYYYVFFEAVAADLHKTIFGKSLLTRSDGTRVQLK